MSPSTEGVIVVAMYACMTLLMGFAEWFRMRRLPDARDRRSAVRAQTRARFRQPLFWGFSGCLYGGTFAIVFLIMIVSGS